MIIHRTKRVALLAAVAGSVLLIAAIIAANASAAGPPTKFVQFRVFGWNVNKEKVKAGAPQSERNVCNSIELAKEAECRGEESEQPDGFVFDESIAVAKNGNVYVGDKANHRIQEFTEDGTLVLMFGLNINQTKVSAKASQAEDNVCTATELAAGAECLDGQEGPPSEGRAIAKAASLAVDQVTNNVYVYDRPYHRVDEFSESGEFILMIGGDVNKTKVEAGGSEAERNVCTAESKDICQKGVESGTGSTAHGAFKPESLDVGNMLSVGGPEDLLYVGDEARVQEFRADGAWVGEISLAALSPTAKTIAVAATPSGAVFVVDKEIAGVHEYNSKNELQTKIIDPTSSQIRGIALDAFGRIGLLEGRGEGANFAVFGLLFDVSGEEVGAFGPTAGIQGLPSGLAFDAASEANDLLYVAGDGVQDVEIYIPVSFPTVGTCPVVEVTGTDAKLCGEIDPNGILARGSFEYSGSGETSVITPTVFEKEGSTLEQYTYLLTGLVPNETYQYAAIVEALAEELEKQAAGGEIEFHTMTPSPDIPGEPNTSFLTGQSAVLNARVNPEHASTAYHFEYGACPTLEKCTLAETHAIQATSDELSGVYGLIGATQEIAGLAANATYSYRLVAENQHEEVRAGKTVEQGGTTTGAEGTFTTKPTPIIKAQTGAASAITTTNAIVSGTIEAGGHPATYTFMLGIDTGPTTQYGTIFTGSVDAGTTPTPESLELTGLQPGVTYAYKILATSSGYGEATGNTQTLTTLGLASILPVPAPLAQLAIPPITFPKNSTPPKTKKTTSKKTKKTKAKKKKKTRHAPKKQNRKK